jgi:hypothetical protein
MSVVVLFVMVMRDFIFNFLMFFFFRIGPCYWLVIVLFTNLMPYMGKGPRWSYEITSVETCKQKWWANAFFFSNFYQADKMVRAILLSSLSFSYSILHVIPV